MGWRFQAAQFFVPAVLACSNAYSAKPLCEIVAALGLAPGPVPGFESRTPLSRELCHESRLQLLPGTYLYTVRYEGVAVRLQIFSPENIVVSAVEHNDWVARDGQHDLLLTIAEEGEYQFQVSATEGLAGFYTAAIISANPTEVESATVAAYASQQEAIDKLNSRADIYGALDDVDYAAVTGLFKQAVKLWQVQNNVFHEARAHLHLANLAYNSYRWADSVRHSHRAQTLLNRLPDDVGEGVFRRFKEHARRLFASALIQTRRPPNIGVGIATLKNLLACHGSAPPCFESAFAINEIGVGEYLRENLPSARDHFRRSAAQFEKIGETGFHLRALNNVAKIEEKEGNLRSAVQAYKRALAAPREERFERTRAEVLENSADAYLKLGEVDEALIRYAEAGRVFEAMGDRLGRARALIGAGRVHNGMGQWSAAIRSFEGALQLQGDVNEPLALFETRISLGNALRNVQEFARATAHHRAALAMAETGRDAATAQLELARDASLGGDVAAAARALELVLKKARRQEGLVDLRADALFEQALLERKKQPAKALAGLEFVLQLYQGRRQNEQQAMALNELAITRFALGRTEEALRDVMAANELVEGIRRRIANPLLRASYTGMRLPTARLQVDILMQMAANSEDQATARKFAQLAWEVSDAARTRGILELLYSRQGEVGVASNGNQALHAQLRERIAFLDTALRTAKAGHRAALEVELHDADLQLLAVESRIWREVSADNREIGHIDLHTLQRMLRGSRSLVVEYQLGSPLSYVWAISADQFKSNRLPDGTQIAALARQVFSAASLPQAASAGTDAASASAIQLSNMLLSPVQAMLADYDTVVLVPDGLLHYLPPGLLHGPGEANGLLLETHELVVLPSVAMLTAQRTRQKGERRESAGIAIYADPIFQSGRPPAQQEQKYQRTTAQEDWLVSLPGSRREAEAIAALAQQPVHLAMGAAANRQAVLQADLHSFRYLHFATHGLVNPRRPALSALALSVIDDAGQPVDRWLRMHDIYSLDLAADLVVLSACATALGGYNDGLGFVGLTQAFFYAGAKQVLASLWRVPDEATAALMTEFYRGLLLHDLTPAAALRGAQRTVMTQGQWTDPFYWAAFVLQGDWRQ